MSKPTDGAVKAAEAKPCPCCGEKLEPKLGLSDKRIKYYMHPDDECVLSGKIVFRDGYESWNTRSHTAPTVKADRLDLSTYIKMPKNSHPLQVDVEILLNALHSAYARLDAKEREIGELVEGLSHCNVVMCELVVDYVDAIPFDKQNTDLTDGVNNQAVINRTLLAKHKEQK